MASLYQQEHPPYPHGHQCQLLPEVLEVLFFRLTLFRGLLLDGWRPIARSLFLLWLLLSRSGLWFSHPQMVETPKACSTGDRLLDSFV